MLAMAMQYGDGVRTVVVRHVPEADAAAIAASLAAPDIYVLAGQGQAAGESSTGDQCKMQLGSPGTSYAMVSASSKDPLACTS